MNAVSSSAYPVVLSKQPCTRRRSSTSWLADVLLPHGAMHVVDAHRARIVLCGIHTWSGRAAALSARVQVVFDCSDSRHWCWTAPVPVLVLCWDGQDDAGMRKQTGLRQARRQLLRAVRARPWRVTSQQMARSWTASPERCGSPSDAQSRSRSSRRSPQRAARRCSHQQAPRSAGQSAGGRVGHCVGGKEGKGGGGDREINKGSLLE